MKFGRRTLPWSLVCGIDFRTWSASPRWGTMLPGGATGRVTVFAAALDKMVAASAASTATVGAGAVAALLLVRSRDFVAEPPAAGQSGLTAPQPRSRER